MLPFCIKQKREHIQSPNYEGGAGRVKGRAQRLPFFLLKFSPWSLVLSKKKARFFGELIFNTLFASAN